MTDTVNEGTAHGSLPATIGEFRILERLAEGAYGELFLAETETGRRVALKRLKPEALTDDKALELFERESRVLRSLQHRAIPAFVDSGLDPDGLPFFVQQHIPGETLEQAVSRGLRFDSSAAQ